MTITLNGERREIEGPKTLRELLAEVGLQDRPVVVEHNRIALLPKEIDSTQVSDGDVIEVVQITAGG